MSILLLLCGFTVCDDHPFVGMFLILTGIIQIFS